MCSARNEGNFVASDVRAYVRRGGTYGFSLLFFSTSGREKFLVSVEDSRFIFIYFFRGRYGCVAWTSEDAKRVVFVLVFWVIFFFN